MSGTGRESWIAIGKENSFGGGATPTQKLEVINFSVPPKIGMIPDPSLYSARSRRALYQGGLYFRGTFTVRLNYEGEMELFRAVLWGYANALVETGVRDHTFKEGTTPPSYEIQASIGDISAGKVFRYLGGRLLNFSLKWTAGNGAEGMGQATFDLWSKDCTSDYTPTGTPAFPAIFPVLHHQAVVVDDGTADGNLRLRSIELSFEAPHDEENFYVGAVNPDEPLPSDFVVPTWRLTQLFKTKTAFEAAKAFTNGSPLIKFQHPTTIGAASKREFQIRSEKANLKEWSSPIEGYGVIIATSTWEAYQDATDASAVVVSFRNTEAALP
jgi:hypothetical protein